MRTVRAVVVAHDAPGHLAIRDVPAPAPAPNEAVVRVKAVSLNRGEVRVAQHGAPDGFRPGWDFAGTIVKAAADGSTPPPGARVVGMLSRGAWCEEIAAPAAAMALVPEEVQFDQAAALPVAGLTAVHALRRNDRARKVLVTGASGGVGVYAVQLARQSGAIVTALLRNAQHDGLLHRLGAHNIAHTMDATRALGPFDLVVESVGSDILGHALGMVAPDGTCVILGATEGATTTFDAMAFRAGGTSLYGLVLGHELRREPPSQGLKRLVDLIAARHLDPAIGVTASWQDIGRVGIDLIARGFAGKAVLHITN